MTPDERALSLAAQIADGTGVSWPAGESLGASLDNAVIGELETIAAIAALHRTPVDSDAAPPGSHSAVWNGLTLIERIGEGRFGEVFRAWDPRLHRHVALKLLHAVPTAGFESPNRAIDEARLMARVRHPNVLTVLGAECADGRIGIWSEFIEGHTLEAWLAERGPLAGDEAAAIGADVCRALAAVHAAGLLHRDVKTANVMREVGGRIVLMDFGTAHDPAALHQGSGGQAGTPLYMAPELFGGSRYSVASDLYATSVLIFRLLSRDYPVTGRTLAEVDAAHAAGHRTRLGTLRPVPPALAGAIERGLETDPSARYPSAAEFADALMPPAATSEPAPAPTIRSERRWPWMVAAALVLGALGSGLWYSSVQPVTPADLDVPVLVCRNCAGAAAFLSHDGRLAAVLDEDSGDIAIRDLSTASVWRLFAKPGTWAESPDYAETPVLSRDASHVAYRWVIRFRGRSELRVMPLTPGGASAVLFDTAALRTSRPYAQRIAVNLTVTPHDWRPDGTAVLVSLTLEDDVQLAWVERADGRVTVVKSLGAHRFDPVLAARVSPDGRQIVYSARAQSLDATLQPARAVAGTKLSLINADGSGDTPLVPTAAANGRPVWTPAGRHVLFTSAVGGSLDLWSVSAEPSGSSPSPVLLRKNIGQVEAMGLTPEGRYLFAEIMPPLDLTFITDLPNPDAGPAAAGTITSVVGINPRWSPDGRALAFLRKQLPSGDRALVVRQMDTQQEHVHTFPGLRNGPPHWTADGQSILIDANRGDGSWWMYRVDLSTGTFHEIVAGRSPTSVRSVATALAPDGRTLYFGARDSSDRSGSWNRIVAVDVSSGDERLVVQLPGDLATWPRGGHLGLAVSPDGRTVAANVVDPGTRRARIFLIDVARRTVRDLVGPFDVHGSFGKVAWTRDDVIWFAASMSDAKGREGWRIMRMSAAGGTPAPVTPFINGFDDGASFHPSPDGSRVAWYPSPGFGQTATELAGPRDQLWMLDLRRLLNALQ